MKQFLITNLLLSDHSNIMKHAGALLGKSFLGKNSLYSQFPRSISQIFKIPRGYQIFMTGQAEHSFLNIVLVSVPFSNCITDSS